MPLKILICGGGCAGPALAFWLAKSGHQVVVVERFPALRASGAQIDLRAQGIEVVKRMGLLETVRSKCVKEAGISFVDANNNVSGSILANTSGKGAQSLTSEYEIMRGDLVRILYEATKDDVEYIFGKTVDRFEQDDQKVVAYFSDGSSDSYDLLVGADGQGSRIRKAILPPGTPDPYRRLGEHMAYWFIPRRESDGNMCQVYLSTGGRRIMRRTHSPTGSHVYFRIRDNPEEMSSLYKAPVEQQKEFWAQKFRGAGWETERFLEGLKTSESFFAHEVVQVCTDTWHKGRVVLLGDAACCPSPTTGMGTTCSFVGAYVLANEIIENTEDVTRAFENYEQKLRPLIDEVQKVNLTVRSLFEFNTQWGIAIFHFIVGWLCYFRIPDFIVMFAPKEKAGWKLPDYTNATLNATRMDKGE
ncbi:monooxygenase [Aspergillus ambiguus]|uniref:monooxygenase n=1 Tax=Aspergillus ambiguus TaxID=176160 RepID=UPI003CCD3D68